MRTPQRTGDLLLRTLIKEYLIGYQMPKLGNISTSSGSDSSKGSSKIFKVGIAAIAGLLGYSAIFGDDDETNDKNPLDSFATNVSNAAGVLASGTDATDIIAVMVESAGVRFLLEKDDTFITKYGRVKSDLIDKALISNIRGAQNKTYFSFPATIKFDTPENFKTSLAPAVTNVNTKSRALFDIVNRDLQTKATGFPADFNQFGLTLSDVDALTDITDGPDEILPANAAMSDAISTAIYNQMKYEIVTFIGSVDEAYKANVEDRKSLPTYKSVLKDFVTQLNTIMTPPGGARSILLPK
jgi:hypothetical protein